MKNRQKIYGVFLIILLVLLLGGCGASKNKNHYTSDSASESQGSKAVEPEANYDQGFDNAGEVDAVEEEEADGSDEALTQPKIIQRAYMDIETVTFDEAINEINQQINAVGGYIERSEISGRRISRSGQIENRFANYTLRIPERNFSAFLDDMGNLGSVVRRSGDTENITAKYFDTESRITTLKIEEERLLEILKKSDKIEDIIELEKRLSEIRYNIESLTTTLRKWDNLVDYCTLELNLDEVQEPKEISYKPITFLDRVQGAFTSSIHALVQFIQDTVLAIIMLLPFILIFGIIGFIVYKIVRRITRKKKEKSSTESDE